MNAQRKRHSRTHCAISHFEGCVTQGTAKYHEIQIRIKKIIRTKQTDLIGTGNTLEAKIKTNHIKPSNKARKKTKQPFELNSFKKSNDKPPNKVECLDKLNQTTNWKSRCLHRAQRYAVVNNSMRTSVCVCLSRDLLITANLRRENRYIQVDKFEARTPESKKSVSYMPL